MTCAWIVAQVMPRSYCTASFHQKGNPLSVLLPHGKTHRIEEPPSQVKVRLMTLNPEGRAGLLLKKQLKELLKSPVEGFSAGLVDDSNIFEWSVQVMGPPDTLYEGGFFKCVLNFPTDYPNSPPSCRFVSEMWHPNVYKDGRVCISILHNPGDDPTGYEDASERWSPVHTVETIMLSIISMLSSPNDESAANIDAAKEWRDSKEEFRRKVCHVVRLSQERS